MRVTLCELCRKRTDYPEAISVLTGIGNFDLCPNCGKSILDFLKKKKLGKSKDQA